MTKEEILKFCNDHPASFFATLEGDQPRVRGMALVRADEKGLLYQTADAKDIWKQLVRNPKVEVSFNDLEAGIQVRITGTIEVFEDQALKEEILTMRPFLKPFVDTQGWGPIKVFRITKGTAYVWTREKNFAPKEFIEI